jgi:hypothetical protein
MYNSDDLDSNKELLLVPMTPNGVYQNGALEEGKEEETLQGTHSTTEKRRSRIQGSNELRYVPIMSWNQ